MSEAPAARPFAKYERFGAYHWREIQPVPTRYNAVLTARYRVLLDAVDPHARRVLDIGCGDGCLTFELIRRGKQVWGLDDSSLPLRLAQAELARRGAAGRTLLTAADGRQLPYRDDSFDCVILADVIEHIDDTDAVMREAKRVLRRGGRILMTTPRRQGDAPPHEYHCREYTAPELADLLRSHFDDVQVQVFQPLAFARLYERRVLGRKVFKILMNCCAIVGWNVLARTGQAASEEAFTDLCATGRKA